MGGDNITNLEKIRDSCPHKKGPVYQTSLYAIKLATQTDEPDAKKNKKKRKRESNNGEEVTESSKEPIQSSTEPAQEPSQPKKKKVKKQIEVEIVKESPQTKEEEINQPEPD